VHLVQQALHALLLCCVRAAHHAVVTLPSVGETLPPFSTPEPGWSTFRDPYGPWGRAAPSQPARVQDDCNRVK
jgi:hypothetical protein